MCLVVFNNCITKLFPEVMFVVHGINIDKVTVKTLKRPINNKPLQGMALTECSLSARLLVCLHCHKAKRAERESCCCRIHIWTDTHYANIWETIENLGGQLCLIRQNFKLNTHRRTDIRTCACRAASL